MLTPTYGFRKEPGITQDRQIDGCLRLRFAAARNRRAVVVTGVVGTVFTATAVGVLVAQAHFLGMLLSWIGSILIAIPLAFIGVMFAYISLYNLLVAADISVQKGSIKVIRGMPIFRRQLMFAPADIAVIGADIAGSSNGVNWFALTLKTNDGKKFLLGDFIRQQVYAESLADEINKTLGVATPPASEDESPTVAGGQW